MKYPFLPVNPCCTDVVLNTPCGCSSTSTNTGCNNNPCNTHLTASSTILYDGPALPCIVAEPCDTLNVILQKIDEIICNLQLQINYLINQTANITNQVININSDIISIYNTLNECCSNVTTTTTSTAYPCECITFYNSDDIAHTISYTDCSGNPSPQIKLSAYSSIQVCGCCGLSDDNEFVTISVNGNCIDGECPTVSFPRT